MPAFFSFTYDGEKYVINYCECSNHNLRTKHFYLRHNLQKMTSVGILGIMSGKFIVKKIQNQVIISSQNYRIQQ
jgi:hypothetical protein